MEALATFIREHKQPILTAWIAAAAQLPEAQDASRSEIADHIPEMLDKLAEAVASGDQSSRPLKGLPNLHAVIRLGEGYDIRQMIAEYRILRRVIMEQYQRHSRDLSEDSRPPVVALTQMHDVVDRAITNAVDQYASERERARDLLISILSHDLRQPLNTIRFGADALSRRGDEIDAATLKTAALLRSSAERMDGMIHDLLDFARGRLGGGIPVVPGRVEVGRLIASAVEEICAAHPEREINCHFSEGVAGVEAHWDSQRVTQAISNLVSNAIAHGDDPIVIDIARHGDSIVVEVRNQGAIPGERLAGLFEPFAAQSPERRRQGLGLGLYIVSEIARSHHGAVSADSAAGQTTMRLQLPRKRQGAASATGDRQ